MKKTCLNCKYEPIWGEPVGVEYTRRTGKCRWDGVIPVLPSVYHVSQEGITIYSDNSGVKTNCKTWEPVE